MDSPGSRAFVLTGAWQIVRPLLLGGLACLAVAAAVLALRPTGEGTAVWVTQRELTIGASVEDGKPRLVMVPTGAVPEGALAASADLSAAGAARFIPARTVLSESDLLGSARASPLQSGESLVNLSVPATTAEGLSAGEIVDLWGQVAECPESVCPPELIAQTARITQVFRADSGSWGAGDSVLVSVALPESRTGVVLLSQTNGSLSFVLRAT